MLIFSDLMTQMNRSISISLQITVAVADSVIPRAMRLYPCLRVIEKYLFREAMNHRM